MRLLRPATSADPRAVATHPYSMAQRLTPLKHPMKASFAQLRDQARTLPKVLLALLTGLLIASAPPLSAQNGQGQSVPAIQDDGDTYILNFAEEGEDLLSLEEFVKLCQEATGRNFTYTKDTATLLQNANVIMFGTKRVPKDDFYNFFQIQMVINEFVCVSVGPPHIEVILIQSLSNGRGASGLRSKAVYVDPRNLEEYADSPATLITTVLNLPNTDVRQLSTSLRSLMTDTNTQNLISAGMNSVILQGFGSQVVSLARLLELVDQESRTVDAERPVFTVIPLAYAAPQDVADLIEQLLEAQNRSNQSSGRRNTPGDAGGNAGLLGSSDVEPKILVDGRTSSLLVMASEDEMPLIQDLIAQLDVDVLEPERNFHVYLLQNVNADDLAEVLDRFLSDAERLTNDGGVGGRAGGAGGGTGSARTSNEVIVVPDPSANALLIAANKTRYEEVLDLIQHLDRRQDQVLIETALIELTGTDFRDIGFEWAFADVAGDGGFGLTNFGLSTLTDSDGDGIQDLRVPLAGQGITGGILSGDDVNIPFLVSALETEDSANVLNVPSVLVNNNGSASVITLDEQPTTTITQSGGVGGQTQENFREFESAGITLEISPSISASRYLRLELSLVVSTFVGQNSGSSAIPSPRITREIHTTVNIPDGYTMVIGGIITDNATESSQGIPWIRNIPLLGALFGRETSQNNRTTLYFFVTPHILRDEDFADLAELSYEAKIEAAKIIGMDRVQIVDPNFGLDEATDIYEPFQVPLYQSPERGEGLDLGRWDLDPHEVQERLRSGREEAEEAEEETPTEPAVEDTGIDPDGSGR